MRSIEDIILEKKYNELSPEELVVVSELAENEEEFNQMKQLFDNMSFGFGATESFEASAETKSSLDSVFTAKHPVIANDWKKEETEPEVKVIPFYSQNWIRVAAVLLVFLGISVVYIQNAEEINPKSEVQQAKAETSTDNTPANSLKEQKTIEPKTVQPTKSKVILAAIPKEATADEWDMIPEHSAAYLKLQDESKDQPSPSDAMKANNFASFAAPAANATSLSGSVATYSFSTSEGLASDLYPNGKPDLEKTNKSSISDVPASDMLDWIQAAY